ncbi:ArsR/SmtB family transcription factor [Candidatus Margulisiibacteriota bacterium]
MSRIIIPIERSVDEKAADFFLALGNKSRQSIIEVLKEETSLPVNEIAKRANVSIHRISDHLRQLKRERIITFKKTGRSVHYSYNKESASAFLLEFADSLGLDLVAFPEVKKDLSKEVKLKLLRLFASEGRCAILRAVSKEELAIGEIQPKVFLEQQTVSDYVNLMRKVKIINGRQEGRFVYCKVNTKNLAVVLKIFMEDFS